MGSRPSGFKKGGGFLNGVDGVLKDYQFTTEWPGAEDNQRSRKKGDSDFNPLYFVLTVRVDGADEDVTNTLFAGSSDDFTISDDGKTLDPVDDNVGFRSTSPFGKFIVSLVEHGFPEKNLPDDGEPVNYEPILGWRVRFVQVASLGRDGKVKRKKAKDGKEYDVTDTQVSEVYGPVDTKASSKQVTASAVKGKPTKANGKATDVDFDEMATETLLAILEEAGGSIMKSKLPGKIALKLGAKNPHREEVRRLIYSDDFLTTENGWSYDVADKKQTITLDE